MGESAVGGPAMAPLNLTYVEERWRHFDNSVDAVSFGFVTTAILMISMFLVVAIFECFHRPRSPWPILSSEDGRRWKASSSTDLESPRLPFAQGQGSTGSACKETQPRHEARYCNSPFRVTANSTEALD